MPKIDIDYSNTIFYKIFCKDTTIKELYVGLTTNFVQRKHGHKQSCKNEKAPNHNCKLYNAIRNAGGWENWQMEIIAFHNCKDSREAHKKEQEYFEMLGATLNSIEPLPKPKDPITKIVKGKNILYCEPCNIHFSYWKAQETHNNTQKHHKMVDMYNDNKLALLDYPKKSLNFFCCNNCQYSTCNSKDYNKHVHTAKHINRTKLFDLEQNNTEQTAAQYTCKKCSKKYKARNSMWYHEQKCGVMTATLIEKSKQLPVDDHMQTNLILELVKQNQELKQLLNEQNKTILEVAKNSQSINNASV